MKKGDKGKKVFCVIVILAIFVSVFGGVVSAVDLSGVTQSVTDVKIQTEVGNLSSGELTEAFDVVTDDIVNIEFADQSARIGVVSSGSSYDRQAAYNYAQKYWNKVCSDGCFWDQSYPPTCGLTPGASLGSREESGVDCAHFVSCCIGNEPNEKGGGLDVDTRVPPAYGEPGAQRLRDWLLNNDVAEELSSLSQVEKGDVIFYDLRGTNNVDHSAFYLGNGKIATHSWSYWNVNWDIYDGYHDKFNPKFIHIKDTRILTVNSCNPDSGVPIEVSPTDNNGEGNGVSSFTRVYDDGTLVRLDAPTNADGNTFQEWQLNGFHWVDTLYVYVSMIDDYTMTAVYEAAPQRTINFYTDPTAGGRLTFDGSIYSNGQSTTKTDATYSVSANPASNYAFDHWSTTGGVSVANPNSQSSTATVSGDGTIKAWFNYIPPERLLDFYTDPTAGGRLTFDGSIYSNGQSTTKTDATYSVSANPASNYAFDHWSTTGGVSVANPNSQSSTATVSGDGTIKAWFNYIPPERLLDFYTDPTAGGRLTFDGSIYSNGQSTTKTDATYSVSANPASNYAFDHWSTTGGVSVANPNSQSSTATVSGDGTIKAWFNYIPPERLLEFYTDPTAGGRLTFDGSIYSNGQSTTKTDATYSVSANPASNYAFDHWSTTGSVGVANPNSPSTTATVSGDGTIKAWFIIPSACEGTDTSCGVYPNCENCNSYDDCYPYGNGCEYRDYYCVSNLEGCKYTPSNRQIDYYDDFVNYCKGDEVWKHRQFHDFYCEGGTCTDHTRMEDDQLVENCNDHDGWVDTGNTKWVEVNECQEKEQKEQEYHDYTCSDGECTYIETGTQWLDTGNTQNKPNGTICGCTARNTLKRCYGGVCTDTGICNATTCGADAACDGKEPGDSCGGGTCDSTCKCSVSAVGEDIAVSHNDGWWEFKYGPVYNIPNYQPADHWLAYGIGTGTPIVGDFNDDNIDDIGIRYNNGWWEFKYGPVDEILNCQSADHWLAYGIGTGTPLVGDFNDDNIDDIGIRYNNGWWEFKYGPVDEILNCQSADHWLAYGIGTGTPMVGDFDNDGIDGIGIRYNNGWWEFKYGPVDEIPNCQPADHWLAYGIGTGTPLVGDFENNGIDGIGIRYNNGWWEFKYGPVDEILNCQPADNWLAFGIGTGIPLVGSFNP